MTDRIKAMREALFQLLKTQGTPGDWTHVLKQTGMFSYTGLTRKRIAYTHTNIYMYMYTCTHIYMYTYTCTHIHVHMYMCTYTCTCTCTHGKHVINMAGIFRLNSLPSLPATYDIVSPLEIQTVFSTLFFIVIHPSKHFEALCWRKMKGVDIWFG